VRALPDRPIYKLPARLRRTGDRQHYRCASARLQARATSSLASPSVWMSLAAVQDRRPPARARSPRRYANPAPPSSRRGRRQETCPKPQYAQRRCPRARAHNPPRRTSPGAAGGSIASAAADPRCPPSAGSRRRAQRSPRPQVDPQIGDAILARQGAAVPHDHTRETSRHAVRPIRRPRAIRPARIETQLQSSHPADRGLRHRRIVGVATAGRAAAGRLRSAGRP
jgi:hypothetical protein